MFICLLFFVFFSMLTNFSVKLRKKKLQNLNPSYEEDFLYKLIKLKQSIKKLYKNLI